MTTASFSGGQYEGSVHFNETPVFIFSPVPVIVDMPDAPDGYPYTLEVTNANSGQSYTETREIHSGKAHFEISRILQHLMSREFSEVFSEARSPRGANQDIQCKLIDVEAEAAFTFYFLAFFGALDQLESYAYTAGAPSDSPATRRLWVNYPQTFTMQADYDDHYPVKAPDGTIILLDGSFNDYGVCEVQLRDALLNSGDKGKALVEQFDSGKTMTLGLSVYYQVSDSGRRLKGSGFQYFRIIPDLTPARHGTYLRWLQRDGSFGYWLFQNGDQAAAIKEDRAFRRTVLGDATSPSERGEFAHFRDNPMQADFTESQTLSLGTYVESAEEFDYLLGLASSPMVERLVYLKDGAEEGWQRVNIAPGSYARSRKRTTPKRSSFEVSIILPQRNTIKL